MTHDETVALAVVAVCHASRLDALEAECAALRAALAVERQQRMDAHDYASRCMEPTS
jgi:hypothetical protein